MASIHRLSLLDSTALTASSTGETKVLESFSYQFVGALKISSINVATTVATKIQHSWNNTDWVDLISFTNAVGAASTQALQIPYAMLTFIRIVVTLSGATQAATVEASLHYDKVK